MKYTCLFNRSLIGSLSLEGMHTHPACGWLLPWLYTFQSARLSYNEYDHSLYGDPCNPPALTVQAGVGTCWYLPVARTMHGLYSGTPFDIPLGLKGPGRRRPCPWQWFHKSGHILAWNAFEMEQTVTYNLNCTLFCVQLKVMNWHASSDLAWIIELLRYFLSPEYFIWSPYLESYFPYNLCFKSILIILLLIIIIIFIFYYTVTILY